MKDFILKERLNPEIISELERMDEEEKKADGSKMVYIGSNKTYGFRKFKTICSFGDINGNNILIWIWQTIIKTTRQNILKYLKAREDSKLILNWKD